ncbi:LiaI-LiaF-like domain-containing protein [Tindallia californiensis]|uniref:Predicted membrane protein n=1 Tax=Tindallia californiensis TaxID=159292 RepID=A0A1H3P707_9FIRM|nr:DUF5668 domain-containing protein [Tindallia californiensis]SDY96149.1 Predicted membrane protein [Tindallia californiensis]
MNSKRQWFLGGVFILLGGVLLANNLGYTDISVGWIFRNFWPLLLIYWGASFLMERKGTGGLVTGLLLSGLGIIILGNRQGWFEVDFSIFWTFFWPVVLILIGINFIKGPRMFGTNNMAILSGIEKTKAGWDFEDGTYWAIMGGVELDLNKARLEPKREYHLFCNAFMGGIEITLPEDVTAYCQGTVVLGGLEMLGDETGGIFGTQKVEQISDHPDASIIHIHSRVTMGGIEIQSR